LRSCIEVGVPALPPFVHISGDSAGVAVLRREVEALQCGLSARDQQIGALQARPAPARTHARMRQAMAMAAGGGARRDSVLGCAESMRSAQAEHVSRCHARRLRRHGAVRCGFSQRSSLQKRLGEMEKERREARRRCAWHCDAQAAHASAVLCRCRGACALEGGHT
jgi:hypothetical protein